MSEHTGFHNKEHYSSDCPECEQKDRPDREKIKDAIKRAVHLHTEIFGGINVQFADCDIEEATNNVQDLFPNIEESKLWCKDCGWVGAQEDCIQYYIGMFGVDEGDVELCLECPECSSDNLIDTLDIGEEVQSDT